MSDGIPRCQKCGKPANNHNVRHPFIGMTGQPERAVAVIVSHWQVRAEAAEAEVERLRAERDAALAMLRRVEWASVAFVDSGVPWSCCPVCGELGVKTQGGHAPDCELAALLEGAG